MGIEIALDEIVVHLSTTSETSDSRDRGMGEDRTCVADERLMDRIRQKCSEDLPDVRNRK